MEGRINTDIIDISSTEELMDHWRNKQPLTTSYIHQNEVVEIIIDHQKNFFIPDGIVDQATWDELARGHRILFVLKEAYESDHSKNGWALNDELRNYGPWGSIWNRVSEWSYGILTSSATVTAKYQMLDKMSANAYLRKTAVMNIKKSNGQSKSVGDEIAAYAVADAEEIIREIELIDPDIVVCGYTFDCINMILGNTLNQGRNENRFCYSNAIGGKERLFIDYYHPANRYPSLLMYYGIVGIYQQAIISKHDNEGVKNELKQ